MRFSFCTPSTMVTDDGFSKEVTDRLLLLSEQDGFEPTFNKSQRTIKTLSMSAASSITKDTTSVCRKAGRDTNPDTATLSLDRVFGEQDLSRDLVPAFITIVSASTSSGGQQGTTDGDDESVANRSLEEDLGLETPLHLAASPTADQILPGCCDGDNSACNTSSTYSTLFEPHSWSARRRGTVNGGSVNCLSSSDSMSNSVASSRLNEDATSALLLRLGDYGGNTTMDEHDPLRLDLRFDEQCSLRSFV